MWIVDKNHAYNTDQLLHVRLWDDYDGKGAAAIRLDAPGNNDFSLEFGDVATARVAYNRIVNALHDGYRMVRVRA